MPRIEFSDLPDHGRAWVFPSTRPLGDEERRRLIGEVDAFLEGWAAHGQPLRSGLELVEGCFLVVGVDEDASRPSGCSIDALVNRLEALGEALGVGLVDHAPIWFREAGGIRSVSREEFRSLAREGKVGLDTSVFDPSLTHISDLRGAGLERPARRSWHATAFFRGRTLTP